MLARLASFLVPALSLFPQPQPDPISTLLDHARAEPIEIFADVAFRLLEAGKIPRNQKASLLEEIYDRAPQAREPHPWSLAHPSIPHGAAEARYQLQRLRLDALSLRARAIQLLLTTDPRHAVELFDELPALRLPPSTCEDPYVASANILYETLAQVLARGRYTPAERDKQRPLEMALRRLREISSPSELGPATTLLRDLILARNWPPQDLVSAYSSSVANLQSDDRSFSFSLDGREGDSLRDALQLAVTLQGRDAPFIPILSAWRIYLARHLQSARCADSYDRTSGRNANEQWREAFLAERNFNDTLSRWKITGVPPLTAEEIRPASLTGSVPGSEWPNHQQFFDLLGAIGDLRTDGQSSNWIGNAERQTPEWDQRAAPVLRRIEDFHGDTHLGANEVWFQRTTLWAALIDASPPGSIFRRALQGWILDMSDARARAAQPTLWLSQFQGGMRMARSFSQEEADELRKSRERLPTIRIPGLPHESASAILEALRAAPDPALALYASLESLAPQSHGSWLR